jgi:NIPSNAP
LQAQVRIYTINRGEMDNFVKHFKEQTKPIHDRIGWPVVSTWINKPQNEFIWIRTHTDAADLEAKTKAFREAVAAAGITLGANVAKMEVREVEMA